MGKTYFVYVIASRKYGALYIGVTSDLLARTYIHREELVPGHASRYHIHHLVHYEGFEEPTAAIAREKQIKKWLRAWKIELIERDNPNWDDLYPRLVGLSQ